MKIKLKYNVFLNVDVATPHQMEIVHLVTVIS